MASDFGMNNDRGQYLDDLLNHVGNCCASWALTLTPRTSLSDFGPSCCGGRGQEEAHTCPRCSRTWIVAFRSDGNQVWPHTLIVEGSEDENGLRAAVALVNFSPAPAWGSHLERDRAVSVLRERGLLASARDWAPGQTVFVAVMPIEGREGMYRGGMYLVPDKNGGWELEDEVGQVRLSFDNLDATIEATCRYVQRLEQLFSELDSEGVDWKAAMRRFIDDIAELRSY